MDKLTKLFLITIFLVAYTGCTTINFDYPRKESSVIRDTGDTLLAQKLAGISNLHPAGNSGFHPLENGIDALTARLILAERAERSIDLQYYLIKDDIVGKVFLRALLGAADRGVRVRILLDDFFIQGQDAALVAIDSHQNIQVRIFNPFNRGTAGRLISSVTSFNRINRRMHNKSFTVDNQVTVIGGRNIADEYFGAREDVNFADLDVVGVGPIVQEVSNMFDIYWKHETALPALAFMKELDDPKAELKRIRSDLEKSYQYIVTSEYADAVTNKILEFIDTDPTIFSWAPFEFVYDSPDKGIKSRSRDAPSITVPINECLSSAKSEIQIISPYFVPRSTGVSTLGEIQSQGVQVTILTNSMAANNHLAVHSGYAPFRKPLLKHGVKIYEVRPEANMSGAEILAASGAKATLHTKSFIVDRKELFIGSFNFDPRSANINTEMGVIVKNPDLANYFARRIEAALPFQTYEVFLNKDKKLRWRGIDNGRTVIYDQEPNTKFSKRFMTSVLGLLPIKGQL